MVLYVPTVKFRCIFYRDNEHFEIHISTNSMQKKEKSVSYKNLNSGKFPIKNAVYKNLVSKDQKYRCKTTVG